MPRIYRKNKENERFLIEEFFRLLGYRISNHKWQGQERPDALLTLSKGKSKKRAAIEHTDYFNDTVPPKGSPLAALEGFWRKVQASLVRRIGQRQDLGGVEGKVKLRRNLPSPKNTELARGLARDIVNFLKDHPIAERVFREFSPGYFDGYATLQSLVASLSLRRLQDGPVGASRSSWILWNATFGNMGLSLNYIKSAIENKTKKAVNYKWQGAEERWLLIVASGDSISNRAGPPTQNVDWTDGELTELCRRSPFDRIVFWEKFSGWYKSLKPNRPIVNFRNPWKG